jgi:hypothetical protein
VEAEALVGAAAADGAVKSSKTSVSSLKCAGI